jgi:pSer/pThr/pTyr-binding forkhead associated (FHA) protein
MIIKLGLPHPNRIKTEVQVKLAFKFDSGKVITHEVFERTFKIGRSENCRVSLDNEGFSREHCLIEVIDGALYITDLGSKNGIYINHVRIPPKLRVSYDTKLPLYMGEAFLTLDPSKEFKDPDHISLQTFTKIDPAEMFKALSPMPRPRRASPRPVAEKKFEKKSSSSSSGFSLVIAIVLIAGIVIYLNRTSTKAHSPGVEQHK